MGLESGSWEPSREACFSEMEKSGEALTDETSNAEAAEIGFGNSFKVEGRRTAGGSVVDARLVMHV